jgi:hypothetical protein
MLKHSYKIEIFINLNEKPGGYIEKMKNLSLKILQVSFFIYNFRKLNYKNI